MCLGVPGKLESIDGTTGAVRVGEIFAPVNLLLTPEARPGDFLMVHAGFALKVMDGASVAAAQEVFKSVVKTRERLDALAARIADLAEGLAPVSLMEVCGTHTV